MLSSSRDIKISKYLAIGRYGAVRCQSRGRMAHLGCFIKVYIGMRVQLALLIDRVATLRGSTYLLMHHVLPKIGDSPVPHISRSPREIRHPRHFQCVSTIQFSANTNAVFSNCYSEGHLVYLHDAQNPLLNARLYSCQCSNLERFDIHR